MEESLRVFSYDREDLMRLDPMILRALIRERAHHTIEVYLYRILEGKMKLPKGFGRVVRHLLEIWRSRGLPLDAPDLRWAQKMLELAEAVEREESVRPEASLPDPFTEEEMEVVEKLLYGRRSIRQWTLKPVPEEMLREILRAGLMAPHGCNLCATRFLVLRDPEDQRLVRSDIPIENGVMIVVCQDMRIYRALAIDERVPQNIYYDAAAAADHMLLMAHALGLGGVWLTHGKETERRLRERFGLPDYIETRCHIVVGWPAEAPIKPQRMSLEEVLLGGEAG
ncbi:MAG: hypothetical protein AYL28_005000 [Candidatus Bathyarchaeota archaeon B23]|nr:MAG: hypothetical protein AYL28_005000 [Candidatus Bathyarchaeota archaeon B23]